MFGGDLIADANRVSVLPGMLPQCFIDLCGMAYSAIDVSADDTKDTISIGKVALPPFIVDVSQHRIVGPMNEGVLPILGSDPDVCLLLRLSLLFGVLGVLCLDPLGDGPDGGQNPIQLLVGLVDFGLDDAHAFLERQEAPVDGGIRHPEDDRDIHRRWCSTENAAEENAGHKNQ